MDPADDGGHDDHRPIGPLEIRVHGIGDHVAGSALGSAPLVHAAEGFVPDTALPPNVPPHRLWLINWSRTSRRRAGLLWYVALPFTLVNVAGYMQPRQSDADGARQSSKLHTVAVVVVGLLLTLCTYVWSVALLETIARRLLVDWGSHQAAGAIIAIVVAAALAIGMCARPKMRPEAAIPGSLLGAHIALIVAAASAVVLARPAHWLWEPPPWLRWLVTVGLAEPKAGAAEPPTVTCYPNGPCVQTALDVVTAVVVGSVALTLLLAGAVAAGGARQARSARKSFSPGYETSISRRNAAAASACGFSLVAAVVLFNSVASALRLFADNGLAYLSRSGVLAWQPADGVAKFEGRGVLPGLVTGHAGRDDFIIDVLPLLGTAAVLAYGVALMAVNLRRYGAGRMPRGRRGCPDCRERRAQWMHRLVSRLPWTLPATGALALVLFVLVTAGVAWLLFGVGSRRPWTFAVVLIQALSVLTAALIVAGRGFGKTRQTLGMVADVLGFWPVRWHPLGGASYRDDVVKAIRERVSEGDEERVALIGHSQGSVLVAWSVGGPAAPPPRPNLLLVTCGSPLKSLYGMLFPTHFDDLRFKRIAAGATSGWVNFWRGTDPIATPLTQADVDNRELVDPLPDGPLLGHSDYWIDTQQVGCVNGHLRGRASAWDRIIEAVRRTRLARRARRR